MLEVDSNKRLTAHDIDTLRMDAATSPDVSKVTISRSVFEELISQYEPEHMGISKPSIKLVRADNAKND